MEVARRPLEIDQSGHQFPRLLIVLMFAPIARLANPKDFALAVEMFDQNPLLGQLPIALLLLLGQGMELRRLVRYLGFGILQLDPLQAFIHFETSRRGQLDPAFEKDFVVVFGAFRPAHGVNHSCQPADEEENFDRVPFFSPEKNDRCFLTGRSISCSVTSISSVKWLSVKAFSLGRSSASSRILTVKVERFWA